MLGGPKSMIGVGATTGDFPDRTSSRRYKYRVLISRLAFWSKANGSAGLYLGRAISLRGSWVHRGSIALFLMIVLSAAPAFSVPVASGGTLVVIIPSRDGIVVAADSRLALSGSSTSYCDTGSKIIIPATPPHVIAAVTGTFDFLDITVPTNDPNICKYLRVAPHLLDIRAIVRTYLETKDVDVTQLDVKDLAERCVTATKTFQLSAPMVLNRFAGQDLFSVVVAGFDVESRAAMIRNFVVRITSESEPVASPGFEPPVITLDSNSDYIAYGETDYLRQHVLPAGLQFLSN
jgi:hypothetical protein